MGVCVGQLVFSGQRRVAAVGLPLVVMRPPLLARRSHGVDESSTSMSAAVPALGALLDRLRSGSDTSIWMGALV